MEFNYRAFTVSLVGVIASFFVVILNLRLLWKFRSSTIRSKPEYHLFRIRFNVDILFSVTVSIYYISLIVSYIFPFVLFEHKFLFVATLLSSNIASSRFFLAAIISTERLIAVFFPVTFHNNRQRISIILFAGMVFFWGFLEDLMYFWYCEISPFVKSCSILACTWNDCFLEYWTGNKLIIGGFSCISSLILFAKLLSFKKTLNFNSDLSKTNYLCIADACLTLIFDFSPFIITLIFKTQLLSADIYGPYNAVAKSLSCLFEAIIANFILKLQSNNSTRPISIRSVNPRSSDRF